MKKLIIILIFITVNCGIAKNVAVSSRDSIFHERIIQLYDERLNSFNDRINEYKEWNTDNRKWVESEQQHLSEWLGWLQILLGVLSIIVAIVGIGGFFVVRNYSTKAKNDSDEAGRILEEIKQIQSHASQHEGALRKKVESVNEELNKLTFDTKFKEEQKEFVKHVIKESTSNLTDIGLESLKNLYHAKALAAFYEERFEDCLRLLNNYLDIFEGDAEIFSKRGFANYVLQNNQNAVKDYTKALELGDNSSTTHNNLGVSLRAIGFNDKAEPLFRQAIKLNNKNFQAYSNLGLLLSDQKNYDEAIAQYSKAIEVLKNDSSFELNDAFIRRNFASLYFNKASAYDKKEEFSTAIENLSEAINIDSGDAEFYLRRGKLFYKINDLNKALSDYDNAIELNPLYKEAYESRMNLYLKIGKNDLAEQDKIKVARLSKNTNPYWR